MRKLNYFLLVLLMAGGILYFSPATNAQSPTQLFLPLTYTASAPLNDYVGLFTIGELNQYDLYTARLDGTDLQRLTTDMNAVTPSWSPDYTQILFKSGQGTTQEWYLINRDGTDLQTLTENLGIIRQAEWAPNGNRIAVVSEENETYQLTVFDAESGVSEWSHSVPGSYPTPLTTAWSPDGSYLGLTISYTETMTNQLSIYTVNADGTNLTRITDPSEPYRLLGWMQNGTRLLVRGGNAITGTSSLFLLNPDGSQPELIYADMEPTYSIVIAPDGERFAYVTSESGGNIIKTFALDHPTPVAVSLPWCTNLFCQMGNIQWSPTSEWLTYQASSQDCVNCYYTSVYITRADGSAIPSLQEPLYSAASGAYWLDPNHLLVQGNTGSGGVVSPYLVDPFTKAVLAELLPDVPSRVYLNEWQYLPRNGE